MFNIVLFVVCILLFVWWIRIGIFGQFGFRFILIGGGFASFRIAVILVVGSCFGANVRTRPLDGAVIRFNGPRLRGWLRNCLLFSFSFRIACLSPDNYDLVPSSISEEAYTSDQHHSNAYLTPSSNFEY